MRPVPIRQERGGRWAVQDRFIACVMNWKPGRLTRPGLPQLAAVLLRDKGIDFERPATAGSDGLAPGEQALVRATMLVAAQAERNLTIRGRRNNPYHNAVHTAHVAVMAGYLGDLNDELVEGYGRFSEFTMRDKLLVLLAAFAHDIDHPGSGNPPDNHYRNEHGALAVVLPILKAAGVQPFDLARLETMIRTTSPNGPHARLKQVAAEQAHHRGVARPDGSGKFPELRALDTDRTLTQMAAILSDADLFASAGTGIAGNVVAGKRLSREFNRACCDKDKKIDFTTPQAREGFMRHIVGERGFASQAAAAGFSGYYRDFVAQNNALLRQQQAPKP